MLGICLILPQLLEGSGWHLEKHMGSSSRTLVTYIVHVSLLFSLSLSIFVILSGLQTDLKELPPIIANRVLKRQPLNAHYLKSHLMQLHYQEQQLSATSSLPLPLPIPRSRGDSQNSRSYSGRHFEEQLSVSAFTRQHVVREGRETPPQQNDSQSCWRSAKAINHSDGEEEDNKDIEPRRKDQQPAPDPDFTQSD